MTKRANGEGTVRQRANGTWEARLSFTDTETGRVERASFYGPTAKAVRDKMKAARDRLDAGAPVKDATRSVGDWLTHWRATSLAASRPQGIDAGALRESVPASTLSQRHSARSRWIGCGRPTSRLSCLVLRGRGLSDSTVRSVYTVLRAGLDGAVRDGLTGPQSRGPGGPSRRGTPRGQTLGRRRRDGGAAGR